MERTEAKEIKWRIWIAAGFTVFLLLLMLAASTAAPAYAAAPALTATQKTAYDLTVSGADTAMADKLSQQHRDFETLQTAEREWEQRISDLHYGSEEAAMLLRKKIGQIDAAKLAKLKQTHEQTKAQHQKLFDLYKSVNMQLEAARKLKNKTLTSMLKAQADGLKIPVQLARMDIKNKGDAYSAAKQTASDKMKKIRGTLSGISPLQVQIKAAKSVLSAPKESRRTVWKSFTQSLTKRDAKSAAGFLASVNVLSRQLIDQMQKIHALEKRVADVIRTAETQLTQSS